MNNVDNIQLVKQTMDKLGLNTKFVYHQCEESNNPVLQQLDYVCGIDWIIEDKANNTMDGVATRIRHWHPNKTTIYEDFTLRSDLYQNRKAEYTKRKESLDNGSLYPAYNLLGWYSGSAFIYGAICKTKDLIDYIEKHSDKMSVNYSDRNFISVNKNELKKAGYPTYTVTSSLYNTLRK